MRFEYEHVQMGTWFRLVAYAPDKATADGAASAAFDRVDALNSILSDYIDDSEVSRLTRKTNVKIRVPVGEDLWRILELARPIEQASGGAFDLTTGPLTRLWRAARERGSPPDPHAIQDAKRFVGYPSLKINPEDKTVMPSIAGMALDLGGVAKGYAADCAIAECCKRGVRRVLVAAGGDVVVADPPPDQKGWRIALPHKSGSGVPDECMLLANGAVSTSGDKNQFLEHGGKRLSHVIDPRSGHALVDSCTVSIVTSASPSNGLMADALATASNVLGPGECPKFIARFAFAGARIIERTKSGPIVTTTPGFEKWEVVPRLPASQE